MTKGVKTMPQYLSPGVYVEEVSSGAAPIAGVGTSTAGFIGHVGDEVTTPVLPGKELDPKNEHPEDHYLIAPAGEPQLVTSWAAFKNAFGDFQVPPAVMRWITAEGNDPPAHKTLAHAVYGFFNNGGTRCWVTRASDELTKDNVSTALTAFAAIDEIALVAVPGALDAAIQGAVLDHCKKAGDRFAILDGQRKKAGDRFAILDGQRTAKLTSEEIRGKVQTSDYAALYFPWIQVYDPVTKASDFVPPSGHLAGIYARVDGERGVHKAPANEVIRGALGVEQRLSKADQDGLNPAGINVIRQFNGNVTVWGARTLGGEANGEWKYVNVRRLFLFLRESIDKGTQWVVFEPNTPALWARITRNVTAFLTNVWQAGALFGDTPEQAFYVKCDAETNPPEVRDLGQVVTEVGVAVVKPAEFVIFRISQWAGPGG
jgi:phage tail sheath protein FI